MKNEKKSYSTKAMLGNKKTRTKVGVKTISVTSKSIIDCDLQPSGGQTIIIEPVVEKLRFLDWNKNK